MMQKKSVVSAENCVPGFGFLPIGVLLNRQPEKAPI